MLSVAAALFVLAAQPVLQPDDMKFLEDLTRDVVQASRVAPGAKVGEIGPNVTGGTLIRPGGRECYPAFWIRDYAMSIDSGFVTLDEQRHALLLTAAHQQDADWPLPSGSFVPAGAIADHISFGNKPIFYPGTLEDYEGQGGKWGYLPALDDHYMFIHMAYRYVLDSGQNDILKQDIDGIALLKRCELAFNVPPSRDNGLVYADEDKRGVSFGFVDSIAHTGELLFCSLLKWQGANEMAALMERAGDEAGRARFVEAADKIKAALLPTFGDPSGYLRASTGKSKQWDVWGTAYAVYIGAIEGDAAAKACETLANAYKAGELAWQGNIRHVPTSGDFSKDTAWEQPLLSQKNTYQNGAYWGTATGWVAFAIARVAPELAAKLAAEYVQELREGDFRKGPEFGSPWECFHPENNHRQNPVYMTTVTSPLEVFRKMIQADK